MLINRTRSCFNWGVGMKILINLMWWDNHEFRIACVFYLFCTTFEFIVLLEDLCAQVKRLLGGDISQRDYCARKRSWALHVNDSRQRILVITFLKWAISDKCRRYVATWPLTISSKTIIWAIKISYQWNCRFAVVRYHCYVIIPWTEQQKWQMCTTSSS